MRTEPVPFGILRSVRSERTRGYSSCACTRTILLPAANLEARYTPSEPQPETLLPARSTGSRDPSTFPRNRGSKHPAPIIYPFIFAHESNLPSSALVTHLKTASKTNKSHSAQLQSCHREFVIPKYLDRPSTRRLHCVPVDVRTAKMSAAQFYDNDKPQGYAPQPTYAAEPSYPTQYAPPQQSYAPQYVAPSMPPTAPYAEPQTQGFSNTAPNGGQYAVSDGNEKTGTRFRPKSKFNDPIFAVA